MEDFFLFVWWGWLAVAVLTLIIEMLVPGFVIACFSVGAVAAAVAAVLGASANVQLLVFAIASVVVLAAVRPFAVKYLLKDKKQSVETNSDALIGSFGKVTQSIDNEASKGYVKVNGDEFMARSDGGGMLEKGSDVEIVRLESTVLIVKLKNK